MEWQAADRFQQSQHAGCKVTQQVFANLRRGLLFIKAQHWRLDLFDDEMAQMLAQTGVVFNHFDGGPDGRCGDGGIATGTMGRDVGVHADRESQAGMAGQGDGAIKQFGQGFQAEELTVLLDVALSMAGTDVCTWLVLLRVRIVQLDLSAEFSRHNLFILGYE